MMVDVDMYQVIDMHLPVCRSHGDDLCFFIFSPRYFPSSPLLIAFFLNSHGLPPLPTFPPLPPFLESPSPAPPCLLFQYPVIPVSFWVLFFLHFLVFLLFGSPGSLYASYGTEFTVHSTTDRCCLAVFFLLLCDVLTVPLFCLVVLIFISSVVFSFS